MNESSPFADARYIAFEGVEGSGKSTVARRIAEYLTEREESTVVVREPGGTEAGERIREVLLTMDHAVTPRAEAALFAASRAQLIVEKVAPALAAGSWVLSDRTAYSSLAYQAGGRGIPLDEVWTLNDIALGGVWPDVVVLLRLDPSDGLLRQQDGDRIGDEGAEFHATVAAAFDALAAKEPDRFIVVDASQPLDDVVAAVIERLGISG